MNCELSLLRKYIKTKDRMEIPNAFLNVSPKKNREIGLRLRFLKPTKITGITKWKTPVSTTFGSHQWNNKSLNK